MNESLTAEVVLTGEDRFSIELIVHRKQQWLFRLPLTSEEAGKLAELLLAATAAD